MSGGGKKNKSYPHTWLSGDDPVRHKQYYVWLQQRNQAQYRNEGWDLDFDTWVSLWGDLWQLRGRDRDGYCMTRRDWDKPWTKKNVEVITRGEHFKRQRERRYS
jgi:hypothetical protein